jgi:hypothetical protein
MFYGSTAKAAFLKNMSVSRRLLASTSRATTTNLTESISPKSCGDLNSRSRFFARISRVGLNGSEMIVRLGTPELRYA